MKSNKIYIAAAIFLLAGLVLAAAGLASVGFDVLRLGNVDYSEKSYTAAGEITAVVVSDRNTAVELVPADGDRVTVDYVDSNRNRYEIEESDGVLKIGKKSARRWYFLTLDFSFRMPQLKIHVPADAQVSLSVRTTNGRVTASKLDLGALDISTTNGAVTLEELDAAGDVELDSSNGRIRLEQVSARGDITCDTTNGAVDLRSVRAESIDADTSNGRIELSDVSAEKDLRLETTNGSVTGLVNGAIADYSITSHTTNGTNNLPERLEIGRKILTVRTTNGRIEIDFDGVGGSR